MTTPRATPTSKPLFDRGDKIILGIIVVAVAWLQWGGGGGAPAPPPQASSVTPRATPAPVAAVPPGVLAQAEAARGLDQAPAPWESRDLVTNVAGDSTTTIPGYGVCSSYASPYGVRRPDGRWAPWICVLDRADPPTSPAWQAVTCPAGQSIALGTDVNHRSG